VSKILVVDDVADNIALLTYDLEERGFDVVGALSGIEALRLAETENPDAILLDVMMPGMSGVDICRRLKESQTLASTPVIMLTARGQDQDVIDGLDAGATDYITKPFSIRVLLARLETALHAKKAQDAIEQANAELQAANGTLDEKNAQLAELNDIAYEFVDNASHDFRTPLSVIKEFASIICDGLAGEVTAAQREYLGIIGNSVEDLTRLVQDMLDVSKSEAGQLRMRRSISTVHEIVERVRVGLEGRATAAKTDLTTSLDLNLPEIYCDAAQIGRVITNLTINAIKFCGEGGHVTIWSKDDDSASQVVIGVTDDGPGIDPDRLQHIFKRFEQVGANARASTKGVGLGLSIAKELVSLNFGQIAVQSEPGKGSTFSFTLPTADPIRLLQRCLAQPTSRRTPLRHVSLLTVQAKPEPSDDMIAEVDELLNDVLRNTDLVLPVAPAKWLLVLRAPEDECLAIAQRIEASRGDTNRNRPTGMLPRLVLDHRGTWRTVTEQDELLASFHEEMRIAEESRV